MPCLCPNKISTGVHLARRVGGGGSRCATSPWQTAVSHVSHLPVRQALANPSRFLDMERHGSSSTSHPRNFVALSLVLCRLAGSSPSYTKKNNVITAGDEVVYLVAFDPAGAEVHDLAAADVNTVVAKNVARAPADRDVGAAW